MPSDLLVVVVGAGCAAAGGLASTLVTSTVARRQAVRDAGRTEVIRKQQLDLYEAVRQLSGLLAQANHQVAWVSRADGTRIDRGRVDVGRRCVAQARGLTRSEVMNPGPEVLAPVLSATDTAGELVRAASPDTRADDIIALRTRWREQLNAVTRAISGVAQMSITADLERAWAAPTRGRRGRRAGPPALTDEVGHCPRHIAAVTARMG